MLHTDIIKQAQEQANNAHAFVFSFSDPTKFTVAYSIKEKGDKTYSDIGSINLSISLDLETDCVSIQSRVDAKFRQLAKAVIQQHDATTLRRLMLSDMQEYIDNVESYLDLPKHISFGQCLFWADYEETYVQDQFGTDHVVTM